MVISSNVVVGAELDMWQAASRQAGEKSNGSGLNSGVGSDSEGTLLVGVGSSSGWKIAVATVASEAEEVGVLVSLRGLHERVSLKPVVYFDMYHTDG